MGGTGTAWPFKVITPKPDSHHGWRRPTHDGRNPTPASCPPPPQCLLVSNAMDACAHVHTHMHTHTGVKIKMNLKYFSSENIYLWLICSLPFNVTIVSRRFRTLVFCCFLFVLTLLTSLSWLFFFPLQNSIYISLLKLDVVTHVFNPQETKVDRSLWVWSQPSLYTEYQHNQDHIKPV